MRLARVIFNESYFDWYTDSRLVLNQMNMITISRSAGTCIEAIHALQPTAVESLSVWSLDTEREKNHVS